jgi:drug/metabolite transporter (DMT)-like permease
MSSMEDTWIWRTVAIALVAPAAWGTTYVTTEGLLPDDRPLFSAAVRALPVGLAIVALRRRLPHGVWWWRSLVLGTCTMGLFFCLVFVAAYRLPGGLASTMTAMSPLVVMTLAAAMIGEAPTRIGVAGGVVGVVGVALLVLRAGAAIDVVGVLAAAGAVGTSALGFVLLKRWHPPTDLLTLTGWQLTAAGLVLAPVALVVEGAPPTLEPRNLVGYAWIGLVGTGLAYVCWFHGLTRMTAGATALVGLVNPVVGTLLGVVVMHETFGPVQALGVALVLGGVVAGQPAPGHRRAASQGLARVRPDAYRGGMRHGIVPPYLLSHLAQLDRDDLRPAVEAARRSLRSDLRPRPAGPGVLAEPAPTLVPPSGPDRTISDAAGTETLPGEVVRREADDPTGDVAADEAYDGLGATYALFADVFGRASIDGAGLPLRATVHYGRQYDNAFWDGSRMVFGDGDGQVFGRFTASLSVIGHELSHGVTQYTADLVYEGQSGALNESVSDVFGALVEQHARGQSAAEASWLIGEGLFTDQVEGNALRSMRAPGTAYDDDVLGRDPQPATMAGYVDTTDDNGGVHLNSGIPNHAFYLVASALGGNAWDAAGPIWYDTISGDLSPTATFADFAAATAAAAATRFGPASRERRAVLDAWSTVGLPIGDTGSDR